MSMNTSETEKKQNLQTHQAAKNKNCNVSLRGKKKKDWDVSFLKLTAVIFEKYKETAWRHMTGFRNG